MDRSSDPRCMQNLHGPEDMYMGQVHGWLLSGGKNVGEAIQTWLLRLFESYKVVLQRLEERWALEETDGSNKRHTCAASGRSASPEDGCPD